MSNPQSEAAAIFAAYPRWRLINEPISVDPMDGLQRDTTLLKEVASGKRGATARIWENPQSLVVTRRETRFPNFKDAQAQLGQESWPVLVRESGGTAVPHEPGIIHFSLMFRQEKLFQFSMDAVYEALCEPLKMALASLGLKPGYGEVKGSYCDGKYNLVVDGLKITGTAQRIIGAKKSNDGVQRSAVMAQSMLMVESDPVAGTDVVNRFYQLAGSERVFDPAVSTSVQHRMAERAADLAPGELTLLVRERLAEAFTQLAERVA